MHYYFNQTNLNFVAIFLLMPHSLATPKIAPAPGQPLGEWANMTYLDNVALFVDDCHEFGVSVAFDMANNLWLPYSVDTVNHRVGVPNDPPGTDPWWPVADETPWDESITWYTQIIEYVERKSRHPESIAWWCMGGNYSLGGAEPMLWDNDGLPATKSYTEKFVKKVWPAFLAAGKRPKAELFWNVGLVKVRAKFKKTGDGCPPSTPSRRGKRPRELRAASSNSPTARWQKRRSPRSIASAAGSG